MPTPDHPDYQEPSQAGRDYYLENGYLVFTEEFLLKRGKCCGSGCRHCPYRNAKKTPKPKS